MRAVLFRTLRGRLMLLASLTTLPAFLFVIYIAANERQGTLGWGSAVLLLGGVATWLAGQLRLRARRGRAAGA